MRARATPSPRVAAALSALSLCRSFVKEAEEIAASRRMNSLTLNRHTEILEVLEIPQLMDTCVRNGYYEEALELAAYVKRLDRKHASLQVIQVSALATGTVRAYQVKAVRMKQERPEMTIKTACLSVSERVGVLSADIYR